MIGIDTAITQRNFDMMLASYFVAHWKVWRSSDELLEVDVEGGGCW
jgi:hypothetical protein